MNQFGIHFKTEDKEKYQEKFLITNHDSLKDRFNNAISLWSKRLEKFIDIPREARLRIEYTNEDAYWDNWVSASMKDGFELKINLHPRTWIRYTKGYPSFLASHEYCGHIIQGQIWEKNVLNGNLRDACAMTTVHGPEMLGIEGLAEVLSYLLAKDDEITIEERLALKIHKHFEMVKNNMHIIINQGTPYNDVLEYAKNKLPFESEVELESLISEKSNDPLFRVYQYVYAIGQNYLERILDYSFENQKKILNLLYNRPLVKEQMDEIFD